MRVLVAMSGGVDSSVAAARLVAEGHDVVGVTLKLWGGPTDSGCCSVADVDDARRVADQLGVDHHVFNLTELFDTAVVQPYVRAHAEGRTPNPCVECNRHVKFGALLERARRLGFDALATGHHARVATGPAGPRLQRGADPAKDQSYVLAMLRVEQLQALVLPVGCSTKAEVRAEAARLGLRTASKPDSQDVCFVGSRRGRPAFLRERIGLHPGELVDVANGAPVGHVDAVELVTVGQRRGLAAGDGGAVRRYAVAVDVPGRRVLVASADRAVTEVLAVGQVVWATGRPPADGRVLVQVSAHGVARPATVALASTGSPVPSGAWGSPESPVPSGAWGSPESPVPSGAWGSPESPVPSGAWASRPPTGSTGVVAGGAPGDGAVDTVVFDQPQRPVAPGQTVAFYDPKAPDLVLGAATVLAAVAPGQGVLATSTAS